MIRINANGWYVHMTREDAAEFGLGRTHTPEDLRSYITELMFSDPEILELYSLFAEADGRPPAVLLAQHLFWMAISWPTLFCRSSRKVRHIHRGRKPRLPHPRLSFLVHKRARPFLLRLG